jgi:K+-sensing histidine kinase KdpD
VPVVPDREEDTEEAELARDGARPLAAPEGPDSATTRSLLSSARHDLGSPLQSIQGFVELLQSEAFGTLSQEQHGFLRYILAASTELREAMEACIELAELELVGRVQDVVRVDLREALADALEQASQQRSLNARLSAAPRMRVKIDRALFNRAIETLLVALSSSDSKSFDVAIEPGAEYARVSVVRTGRSALPASVAVSELARGRRITRNLIWFRLANALFTAQDASLSLGEQLDYAEVRIRLSATH